MDGTNTYVDYIHTQALNTINIEPVALTHTQYSDITTLWRGNSQEHGRPKYLCRVHSYIGARTQQTLNPRTRRYFIQTQYNANTALWRQETRKNMDGTNTYLDYIHTQTLQRNKNIEPVALTQTQYNELQLSGGKTHKNVGGTNIDYLSEVSKTCV